jgi:hypothetical protein
MPALLLPLGLAGCLGQAMQAPTESVGGQVMEVDISAQRSRVAAQNTEAGYLGLIELTADSIIRMTDDPVVARNALAWKANAIPAIQRALHNADPLISWVDGRTLLEQMRQFFDVGAGRDLFGEEQSIAVGALDEAGAIFDRLLQEEVSEGDYGRISEFVRSWTAEHPLDNGLFVRDPVAQVIARELGSAQLGGLDAVGRLEALAVDTHLMAQSYLTYTPKVLLWQAELMAADMFDTGSLGPLLDDVDRMAVMQAATRLLESTPELIAAERRAAFAELAALTEREGADLATAVAAERVTILNEVARVVREERSALTRDVEAALIAAMREGGSQATAVVDHVLLRAGVGLLALVLLIGIAQYVLLRRFLVSRERRPTAG